MALGFEGAAGAKDEQSEAAGYRHRELEQEREYVSALYRRLDQLADRESERRQRVQLQEAGGTHQSRFDRDVSEEKSSRRLSQLSAANYGLCFGRLDMVDGDRRYVGRLSLFDEEDHEPLLIDWRAPAAEGFYRATPAAPAGVLRRRQLRTRERDVIAIDDEVFDLDALNDDQRESLNGEAALFAALTASRTGRMRDIVATIQAEQDRVIRADLSGILVVQGGPGTGKTVVALHRAAYLLYTFRERLSKRGVLVVGPNPTFVRYIDEVLPSLGENDVLLSSVGQLYPGLNAVGSDPAATAAVKGSLQMAEVLANAVKNLKRVPEAPLRITVNRGTIHEDVVELGVAVCERARAAALESGQPHNHARRVFQKEIITRLARLTAESLGSRAVGHEDLADIATELRADPDVRAALHQLWPVLTPQQLLIELFSSPDRLAAAAPDLSEEKRAALWRAAPEDGGGERYWTPSDVPLLDEAAELLGDVQTAEEIRRARAAAAEHRAELAYAEQALEEMGIKGLLSSEQLLEQYHGGPEFMSTAERAAKDRSWAFGHIIVDEAQELSPMAWRVLMRRCPSRSMTIVGDIAQTGAVAGTASWHEALDRYVPGRWRQEQLTINYRTPSEIMAVAADVLRAIDPDLTAPRAVRASGTEPWSLRVEAPDLAAALPGIIEKEADRVGDGRLAIIVPTALLAELRTVLAETEQVVFADEPSALDAVAVVLTVEQSKGLEFDSVLVVEPGRILADPPNGTKNLYVAVTRATQRLGVIHSGELPELLRALSPSS
ncbi:HelD family protein [Micromonospora eburnea]|uniref:DNA helicase IV n=1 Tax=Micromonospora eburnea TaxID=227316 RepID=A0A1C6V0S8_9ACTN|nr:ATP-binding domain-containing protein [Micromonospora eburnea]SCL59905.1 DNA helicase IV [Micromonospora eburnea]